MLHQPFCSPAAAAHQPFCSPAAAAALAAELLLDRTAAVFVFVVVRRTTGIPCVHDEVVQVGEQILHSHSMMSLSEDEEPIDVPLVCSHSRADEERMPVRKGQRPRPKRMREMSPMHDDRRGSGEYPGWSQFQEEPAEEKCLCLTPLCGRVADPVAVATPPPPLGVAPPAADPVGPVGRVGRVVLPAAARAREHTTIITPTHQGHDEAQHSAGGSVVGQQLRDGPLLHTMRYKSNVEPWIDNLSSALPAERAATDASSLAGVTPSAAEAAAAAAIALIKPTSSVFLVNDADRRLSAARAAAAAPAVRERGCCGVVLAAAAEVAGAAVIDRWDRPMSSSAGTPVFVSEDEVEAGRGEGGAGALNCGAGATGAGTIGARFSCS
uniref:Uncharacterized protein n=1 Tax=Pristionchus pacificus TaxID=54126 RepID=A0A2A6CGJ5_PRIPA|eukprot:PDM77208.1 hypothetical protein PRIPAC_43120 [Pristionchus pacificus]